MNNVVVVSSEHGRNSPIHIHVSIEEVTFKLTSEGKWEVVRQRVVRKAFYILCGFFFFFLHL